MDDPRLEGLLRERGRRLAGALAGEDFARRAQAAMRAERGRPHLRLVAPLALLAAAAALALVVLWRAPREVARRGVAFEVAVLDEAGRELVEGEGVRGPGEDLPPPNLVRLEVVAEADGFARAFLYDAAGRLRAPREGAPLELRADLGALATFQLDGAWQSDAGQGGVTWLIVCADGPFESGPLGVPAELAAPDPDGRRAELERLAARIAGETGLAVAVRRLE